MLEDSTTCKDVRYKVNTELNMSDEIVYKDLLRFYKPEGYTPINPNDYEYLGPKGDKVDRRKVTRSKREKNCNLLSFLLLLRLFSHRLLFFK